MLIGVAVAYALLLFLSWGALRLVGVRSSLQTVGVALIVAELPQLPLAVLGLGLIGLGYTIARTVGKIAGARIGLHGQDVPEVVRRQLGFCLVSSSSLAVGLTIQIRAAFPTYAATITGIVLAAVVIFEVVGPLLTRRALVVTGEAKTMPSPLMKADSDVSV